jgi:AefR-like transcriptional repressor, C-terminal domain
VEALVRFGLDVLSLLLGPRSLTINRAAIAAASTSPELGRILATEDRETSRPLVQRLLTEAHRAGRLKIADPDEAFEILSPDSRNRRRQQPEAHPPSRGCGLVHRRSAA